jgi:hypothetical protein
MCLQALPIFLDKLVDPVTAVVLSVSVVLVIGGSRLAVLNIGLLCRVVAVCRLVAE